MGKERFIYEPQANGYYFIFDKQKEKYLNVVTNVNLLNQQSLRIEELKQENQQLKEKLKDIKNNYRRQIDSLLIARLDLFKQFKQSQNQKAIEVLEDINKTIQLAKELCIEEQDAYHCCLDDMQTIVNNQIKELKVRK